MKTEWSDELNELRALTVPTLANAVELFGVVPPNSGFTRAPLACHFPALGICIGYAVTVQARTDQPAQAIDALEYRRWLAAQPGPKIVVLEDLDEHPGGAMWGEWNANVHLALGCVGTVTEGAVRDLDALERLGFHTFATSVSVAHGYGVFVGYDEPVTVAELPVVTGDLLVGDQHGVLRIPPEIPRAELAAVAREIDRLEAEIFACCQSPDFSVDRLTELQESVLALAPPAMNRTDRLYAIVEELRARSPRAVSAAKLAERFEVSTRTVERDVLALQEAGVPIYAETGRLGGYVLDAARTLPPVNFSAGEAAAVAVSLQAAASTPFASSARAALTKIMAAMTEPDARAARELGGRVLLYAPPAETYRAPVARAVEQAIVERRVVRLHYVDRSGAATERVVEPLAVVGVTPNWYLTAWCRLRDDVRWFRVDRIRDAFLTRERAPERVVPPLELPDLHELHGGPVIE